MPDINDIYGEGQAFLKTTDVKEGDTLKCKIKGVRMENLAGKTKLVVDLKDDKAFVLNKTNAGRLAKLFDTPDYTKWNGREFALVRSYTSYAGNEVPCLRVQRELE